MKTRGEKYTFPMKIGAGNNRKSHYPSKNDKKCRIVFFQRKKEKNALKSKKKWFRWHFSSPQKAKTRGVKGRMKGVKQEIS